MITDPAKVEDIPVSPNKKLNTLLGAFLGIMLSGGIVVLRIYVR